MWDQFDCILRDVHRNKNSRFIVCLQRITGGIFLCGCFPTRTDATVSFITPVLLSANFLGWKPPPVSRAQNFLTALRNFPFRARFIKERWFCSSLWIPRYFSQNPVAAVYAPFTSSSNAPRLNRLSWNLNHVLICLAVLTAWLCCRITDWKMTTCSEFHLWARMPSRSTERFKINFIILEEYVTEVEYIQGKKT